MAPTRGKTSFFATEETERFELEPGYWVELKTGLDYGEESELEGAAVRFGVNIDQTARTAEPKVSYSIRDQRILMLALYIVDWNLPNARGRTVPLPDSLAARQELFSHLEPKTAAKIVARIEEIRAVDGEPEAISLEGLEMEADEDPTQLGDDTGRSTPSLSPSGTDAAIETSFEPQRG